MKIKNSVVFITGAAKRIGRAVAKDLAGRGAKLIVHYNQSDDAAKSLKKELEKAGHEIQLLQADLRSFQQVKRLSEATMICYGHVDVVIHNASTFYPTALPEVTEENWQDLMDVNAKAPFFLSQWMGDKMKRRGCGKIISLCDWSYQRPDANYIPYAASKAALTSLSQGLAKKLAPEVQVNTLLLGPIMWPDDLDETVQASVLRKTPLARCGKAEEVCAAIRFFIEEADFCTGSQLHIDGGRQIY